MVEYVRSERATVSVPGGGGVPPDTLTLSYLAVFSVELVPLVTATHTFAEAPIVTVAVPTVVQVEPFAAMAPAIVEPVRVSLSHAGGACVPPAMNVVDDPVLER